MIDEKINQKYLKKIKLFNKYNKYYYDLNEPLVKDHIFDELKNLVLMVILYPKMMNFFQNMQKMIG